MPIRTKMFLGWVALTLALWAGAFWVIRRSVADNFHRLAGETFAGISRGLNQQCAQRVTSMQQACRLVANIPELRALIAEQNYELDASNQDSLRERLENVQQLVGATFVCALSSSMSAVAQNDSSPWRSLGDLNAFLSENPAACALLARGSQSPQSSPYGLWIFDGRLYQVAALPLVFQTDAIEPVGMLLMGKQLTGEFCRDLGQSYGCQLTFLAGECVLATSLPPHEAASLAAILPPANEEPTTVTLDHTPYRVAQDGLIDPGSGLNLGAIVVQRDEGPALAFLRQMSGNLLWTMFGGVAVGAVASFFLSSAITRPLRALSTAVGGVGAGQLDVEIAATGRDELGQLAKAFNGMVAGLRQSRGELERMLEEARESARREHLLREVTQQINQRLDVQSSLTMFITSVRRLFHDVDLSVFHFDQDRRATHITPITLSGGASLGRGWTDEAVSLWLKDASCTERLERHESVIVGLNDPAAAPLSIPAATLCLVPMVSQNRLQGAIAAVRSAPEGYTLEERTFLQALADHFAIALANAQVHEELRKAYQDLRSNQRQIIQTERLRALGQMASGIAHDFNNHLTIVLAFLEMALDRDDLDDELRNWLQMSREASLGAADVVKLLRSFYRRESADSLEPVDLDQLVNTTISITRPRWFDMPRQHGIVVHVHEDTGGVGRIRGNAAELRDVLTNLLFNAVDALPVGGNITIRTRRQGDEVTLEVIDDGAGMSEDVREQCLDPFFTTKGTQGTGLGLSMVHGIVERHRGRLQIESQSGRGTQVRIVLAGISAVEALVSEKPPAGDHQACRVLCLDDDPRILLSLSGMLKQMGNVVVTADSGPDALERLAGESFDVLITDLGMPGMDGREVARRAKAVSPGTHIVMLTGWADRLMVEGQWPDGVDQVIGKPITRAQLQQTLAKASAAAGC